MADSFVLDPPTRAPAAARNVPAVPEACGRGEHDDEEPRTQFLDAESRDETCRWLGAEGVLVVRVAVAAAARGNLATVIEEAIERELDARGAAPAGFAAAGDPDAGLSDLLYRARRVGRQGIALSVGPLRAASPGGALAPEDALALRFWAAASEERPVWLLLDASDRTTGAYAEPVPLASVLTPARPEPAPLADKTAEQDPLPPVAPIVVVAPPPAAKPPVPPASVVTLTPQPPLPREERGRSGDARHPSPPVGEGPGVRDAGDAWRPWASALTAAHGPQSLAAFERLFAHDYMPLANAISAGLTDARAVQARDEFRRTFARAYTEAAPAFAVTGKRPRMVLDAPDLASRIARLHGARTTQLLLVDAMRFDVGAAVRDRVSAALAPRAQVTDEIVLWSALPTTTLRQLETLQRGAEALRIPPGDGEREMDPLRGRTAEVIRRVKVGSRDFYKLDVVESRVRDMGDRAPGALGEIAELAADAIVRHAQTLQPRTLLFVFGDHGFAFDREGLARQGGASPEEVLVPAFALLVGDVH